MQFIALDPGTSTGVATYDEDGIVLLDVIEGKFNAEDWFHRFLDGVADPSKVQPIIEDFRPRPHVVFVPDSLHIIGVVDYLSRKYGTAPLVLQSPAEAKGPFPDKVLKGWGNGWYHRSDHARDAARHLAVTLVRRKLISPRTGLPPNRTPDPPSSPGQLPS